MANIHWKRTGDDDVFDFAGERIFACLLQKVVTNLLRSQFCFRLRFHAQDGALLASRADTDQSSTKNSRVDFKNSLCRDGIDRSIDRMNSLAGSPPEPDSTISISQADVTGSVPNDAEVIGELMKGVGRIIMEVTATHGVT